MASGETSCPESTPRSSGSSPAPYTLAVGTLPDTMHTRYCTHSDVTRDEPAAERRRCLLKVMLGRSCALTSLQDLRVAGPYQRVAGMKHELNGERGEAEVPRGQDRVPDGAPLVLCTWPPPRPTPQAPSHPAPTGHWRSR